MSVSFRNQTSGILERAAGFSDTDAILSPSSRNPIQNRAVYAALAQKIDKTVSDLVNYYNTSQTYNKQEVRELIGSINTLTIEVVSTLPTQDISSTTIYFVGPQAGTNTYDEYVYVNNAWVQIGDTQIDLSNYVTSAQLTTALQNYYTKSATDALFNDYYDKDTTDTLLDAKQNALTFDNAPIAGSANPVTSNGIKTALDNILITGNGGSIIKVHHYAGAAAAGDTVTASKGSYSVSTTFDLSGDAILIGFGEIGNITITATNGSETGTTAINIPYFGNYSTNIGYGLDYKAWLIEGGMNPSSYSSLDEVLADEEAIRRLMTKHASVDYLASCNSADDEMAITILNNDFCAKWINLRDYALDTLYANEYLADMMDDADKYFYGELAVVPLLSAKTSNSDEYGEASASSESNPAFRAFRLLSTDTDGWSAADGSQNNSWVQYDFKKNTTVYKLEINLNNRKGNTYWRTYIFNFLGSNDGTHFETIANNLTVTQSSSSYYLMYELPVPVTYRYYRLTTVQYNVTYSNGYTALFGVQFYGLGLKCSVPEMTNNTAPYGAVNTTSSLWSGYSAWQAFSLAKRSQGMATASGTTTGNVQYRFPNPICVKKFSFEIHTNAPKEVELYGSSDGTTFIKIGVTQTNNKTGEYEKATFNCSNSDYYLYYRLNVLSINKTDANYDYVRICCLQFYGREMKVSVPVMTNNSAPYGKAFASSELQSSSGTCSAFHAFDKISDKNDGSYVWAATGSTNEYVGYEFDKKVLIKKINYYQYNSSSGYTYRNFKIQASDDETTWTDLYIGVNNNTDTFGTPRTIDLDNDNAYKMYRFYIVDNYGAAYSGLPELELFGFDYSERDWDIENPRHYIYDHGVKPNEVISFTSMAKEDTDKLYINHNAGGTAAAYIASIDLADYTLSRCINGITDLVSDPQTGSADGDFGTLSIMPANSTPNPNISRNSYTIFTSRTMPYNNSHDVSSYNGNYELAIDLNSAGNRTWTTTIAEWWLE